jgi:hypothetical protein
VLEALDVRHQAPVVRKERGARIEIALHQCRLDEDVACKLGVERPERHAAIGIDR